MTQSSVRVDETKDLAYCSSHRAQRVIAHALLPFLDSVALMVSLRDVLHCRSTIHAQFRSRSSLLTPPRAATDPVGFFTWSWL